MSVLRDRLHPEVRDVLPGVSFGKDAQVRYRQRTRDTKIVIGTNVATLPRTLLHHVSIHRYYCFAVLGGGEGSSRERGAGRGINSSVVSDFSFPPSCLFVATPNTQQRPGLLDAASARLRRYRRTPACTERLGSCERFCAAAPVNRVV